MVDLKKIKRVFRGKRFDVGVIDVKGKHGDLISREMVIHPGAVVILPIIDKESIIMIKNERFAVGKTLWELPAGTLEPGEPPEETAKRELIEETGYQCAILNPLLNFYTTPGFCNEMMYSYVASELSFVGQALEESEKIETVKVKWKEALDMISKGDICDGKTITTLLLFQSFYR